MGTKKLTYREAFEELQAISVKIKENLIPIEQLPKEIQRAKSLVKYCQDLLKEVEIELIDTEKE